MKKSLSILLALLMILSSMPIMAFTASAEQADPNVMADYSVANGNFGVEYYGSVQDSDVTCKGGNGVYVTDCMSQTFFTKVTLKANATYNFSFNWKAEENASGGVYPDTVNVYSSKAGDPFDISNWDDSKWPQYQGDTTTYLDLESGGTYGTQDLANQYTWNSVSTTFTTTTDEEYIILIVLQTANANHQNINFSDFRLIDKADSASIAIEDKYANDWFIPANAKIYDDTSLTQDGITSDYRYEKPTWQKLSTAVTLEPNTKYTFSFDYYAEVHTSHNPYVQSVAVYSADQGVILDAEAWDGETYIGNTTNLATCLTGFGSADKAGAWQHVTLEFITTESEKYNILIQHSSADASGSAAFHSDQKIYYANFEIESFVAIKPGNILNNATYVNGDVSWSKNINTGDSGDLEAQMSFAAGLDNPEFSINGGYAWAFNFGYDTINGVYGYVYIKANDLKADTTYDLSYICVNDFRFKIDSIKNDTAAAEYIVTPAYATVDGYDAEKTTAMFTVPEDGDYVITLISNKDSEYRMAAVDWSGSTYLCDLELYERGAMCTVAVDTEGNGAAKADKTGLIEEGTTVTFTATPELYERFLGWYNGDELVAEDLVYTTTVAGELNLVAKFTTNSENLMADYTVAGGKFVSRYWGSPSDSAVSRYGGNAVYLDDAPHQTFVTKATLEAGKEYTFSFEWKSENNQYNNLFPARIEVRKVNTPDIDILGKKEDAWVDGKGYKGELGEDIETGVNGSYANQDMANSCEWNNITVKFTATEAGEYGIIIPLTLDMQDLGEGSKHYNNKQSIYFSDFVLKTEPVIEYTGTHYDWNGVHWSEVSDSADSHNGGYAYSVAKAMSQNINTTLTLKPGTTYRYSFDWKAIANDKGLAFAQSSSIYSANSGDSTKGNKTNYNWYDENDSAGYVPIYIPNEGYSNLMTDVSNPNGVDTAEDDVLKGWNTYSATFTTIEDEEYYLFINFGLKGAIGNQTVIISDVIIEEVTVGTAPAGDAFDAVVVHGGTSLRKENEAASSGASSAQAIRYKFTVAGDLIANAQTDGYWLEEYGAIVARADQLEGHAYDPIFGATAYSIKQGVAYNKTNGTNIKFAEDSETGDITFTAALYNIPGEQYGTDLAVRPYAKFMNSNGDTYIRYGTTWYACVFDVAKAILDDANADADDVTYVNNTLLAGDIKAAYDAWVAAQ